MSTPKTLAMRRLDAAHVAYDAHAYAPTLRDAAEVASALGVPSAAVYKTLVVQRPAGRPQAHKTWLAEQPGYSLRRRPGVPPDQTGHPF